MTVIGHGAEVCTSTTRPATPSIGSVIYQTDTNEYLTYVNYGGSNRWMQADLKPNRRININGNMGVWQRGTGPVTTDGQYLADRYQCYNVNSYSRSTDTPSGQGFPYSISFGYSSTSYSLIMHKIEAVDAAMFVGKYLTISFWAKNVSGSVGLYADFLSPTASDNWAGVNNWSSRIGSAVVPTSNWTYYSFTSSVVAPASVANGLGFYIPRNNGAATTLVTGIQLEVGTAPSEFEFESYETTLRKCQRYYEFSDGQCQVSSGATGFGGNSYWSWVAYKVTKRTAPSPGSTLVLTDVVGNVNRLTVWKAATQYNNMTAGAEVATVSGFAPSTTVGQTDAGLGRFTWVANVEL
jgi:hypothetical protein